MKALVVDHAKAQAQVRDIPLPEVAANDVLVRVTVAGVNPVDWKQRDGGTDRTFPFVIGQDFAGIVDRTGVAVKRVLPGDRVFGVATKAGAYAQMTIVSDGTFETPFALIPAALGDDRAAALPTPALTALASLAVLDVKRGSSLLVIGAAGAVGATAVQLAHLRGAEVTAFVRPGQEAESRSFGADAVIVGADARTAVRAEREKPFDAVLDLVSNADALKENAILVRPGGRLVTTIHVADSAWFADRGITATNIVVSESPEFSVSGLDELAKLVVDGALVIKVAGEKGLEEAGALLDDIKAGKASGKFVLRIDAGT